MPDLKLWEAAFERCKAELEAVHGEMDRWLEEAQVEAEEGRESQRLRLLEVTARALFVHGTSCAGRIPRIGRGLGPLWSRLPAPRRESEG